jgi:hypothetical protein
MPCHDKKLEASRKDFVDDNLETMHSGSHGGGSPRVDMVLTTSELWQLLQDALNDQLTTLSANLANSPSRTIAVVKEVNIRLNENNELEGDVLPWNQTPTLAQIDTPVLFVVTSSSTATPPCTKAQQSAAGVTPDIAPPLFAWGSGGYADYIFRYAAFHLFGLWADAAPHEIWHAVEEPVASPLAKQHASSPISAPLQPRILGSARMRKRLREYYEACLCQSPTTGAYFVRTATGSDAESVKDENPNVVLRFAMAYGMQTVQSVLTRHIGADSGQSVSGYYYDYIEAMACQGSCLNGGGQLRLEADRRETPTETRQRILATQEYFVHHYPMPTADKTTSDLTPPKSSTAGSLVAASTQEATFLYTRYHVVPPMQHSMGAAAGVAVTDTVW